MFSWCFHGVPKLFLKTFPIAPRIYAIWFCPKFNYQSCLFNCKHKFDIAPKMKPMVNPLSVSPRVLSMWLQTVKFIVKKSKCAGLAQEIGFFCTKLMHAGCRGWWKAQQSSAPPKKKKSVINWTWLRLSIFDWSIIMIGPGGLLLVVPTYLQFQLQFYWWGCQKKKQLNLRHFILFYYPKTIIKKFEGILWNH